MLTIYFPTRSPTTSTAPNSSIPFVSGSGPTPQTLSLRSQTTGFLTPLLSLKPSVPPPPPIPPSPSLSFSNQTGVLIIPRTRFMPWPPCLPSLAELRSLIPSLKQFMLGSFEMFASAS
ncbi:hypothetical protein ACFX1R_019909 [Malus domestica]